MFARGLEVITHQIDWDRIETFIGYGRVDAPVVFLGMEEGGPSDEDAIVKNLINRSGWERVIDIPEKWEKRLQSTWRPMCEILLRRQGAINPTREQKIDYQNSLLGRQSGDSLITELMPLPKRSVATWPNIYEGRYGSRESYMASVRPKRIDMLKTVLRAHPREAIVCFGKAAWNHYARIFDAVAPTSNSTHWHSFECKYARQLIFCPHFAAPVFYATKRRDEFADFVVSRLR
jgi:hypothetical protein